MTSKWYPRIVLAQAFVLGLVCFAAAPAVTHEKKKGTAPEGLELAWSLEGTWSGVVSDQGKGTIYALSRDGKCVELDLDGKQQREFQIACSGGILRTATLGGDKEKALLVFSPWGNELQAYDLSGKQLWSYSGGGAIDDVWAGDLNGDGSDEVIIGHNGSTGLHVLDGKGKLLWKSTAIGNVWHVCAGDLLGEGKPQVVTTSASGKLHVFDGSGKQSKDLDPVSYAQMVRIGKLSAMDKAATIFVAGTAPVIGREPNQNTVVLACMSGQGDMKWLLELPFTSKPHVDSAQLAPGKPWLAAGMRDGQVHVVDFEKEGKIIAGVDGQGKAPEVAWACGGKLGAPLLLVATSGKLNAFRIAKSK